MRKLTEKITGPLTTSEVFGEWEPIGKQGEKEFKFELLTPMFGGGPKAGHINSQEGFELRAATVRGHLREWWRRLYRTSSNGQLLKLEAEIWGAVGQKHGDVRASNVKIQVQVKSTKELLKLEVGSIVTVCVTGKLNQKKKFTIKENGKRARPDAPVSNDLPNGERQARIVGLPATPDDPYIVELH